MIGHHPTALPPVGAKTITPGRMDPGDLITDLDGRTTFTVNRVEPIKIYYNGQPVEVWWIMGYVHTKEIMMVCVPRQAFYLIRRNT